MPSRASDSGFHFASDYIKCQQYFYWHYVRKLEAKYKSTSLIFGGAIHAGLEAYYRGAMEELSPETRVANMLASFSAAMQEEEAEYAEHEWYDADLARGLKMLTKYEEFYRGKDNFKVLAVEEPVRMTLATGDEFTGTIDLKIRKEGQVFIVDHKTTKWGMTQSLQSLSVSDQATGYTLIHNVLHPEEPAVGLIYNVLRNNQSVFEFSRALVVKSRKDQERFQGDITSILDEIATKMANPEARWVRNTQNCYAFNRPCPFLELCQGANFEGLIGSRYKVQEATNSESEDHAE